ncbi:MAG TPA: hypothetical protein PKA64_07660 [Myxococcota bacterium]|nr:hypothetical protein [Myxococcota bacterium]
MLSLFLALARSPAAAIEPEPPVIEIVSDPLARWAGTRWRLDTQLGFPYPVVLYAEQNAELQVVSMDVHLVVRCDLEGPAVRGRAEALCEVEDAAISAAPWVAHPPHADEVLQETDDRLTGLRLELQVDQLGRLIDVGVLDKPQTNQRVNAQYENLRQIVRRALLGFHAQTPDTFVAGEQYYERNTPLLTVPAFRYSTPSMVQGPTLAGGTVSAGDPFLARDTSPYRTPRESAQPSQPGTNSSVRASALVRDHTQITPGLPAALGPYSQNHPIETLLAPASFGRNTVASKLDMYKGAYVVQSVGEGSADIGADVPIVYMGKMTAVAVFDPALGYMSERRWTVSMSPTASSLMADGVAGWPYWQIGSLERLGPDEQSPVGPSVVVAPPHEERGNLPPWPTL